MSQKMPPSPTSPTPPEEGLSKPGYITANPLKYAFVKPFRDQLKKNPTKAEEILWQELRNKKTGYKFRRQHIISSLIVDFVCLREKLVIEVDGKIHLSQVSEDMARTQRLNVKGYPVIRFTNEEIIESPIQIALEIKNFIESNPV